MAEPTKFEGANWLLLGPGDIGDLPVMFTGKEMVSCWQLTPKELEDVNRTGKIYLNVLGKTSPPVFISADRGMRKFVGGKLPYQPVKLELDLEDALGDQIRESDEFACKVWGSLANSEWRHIDGYISRYSFREAGSLISKIVGNGSYLDWYCSYDYPYNGKEILEPMKKLGWTKRGIK